MEAVRIALRNVGKIKPDSIDAYFAVGGYEALKKARTLDRGELIKTIEETSRLRGRGGAAFATGKKWSSAFASKEETKYIVCNADEGEPGTYKDRVIMEGDPHTVIEGILIGAYAIGAKECFIYVRGEYENSIKLLRKAVGQAVEKGLTGDVSIKIVSGAGSYICGEGTAIVNSIEGLRGKLRLKPPSMAFRGLYQKPTNVNNVETFAVIPEIVNRGTEWFGSIGAEKFPGTKLMCLSGDVQNKVCVEVPTDTTLRDVVEGFGGGVAGGKKLKAIQLGGSSCGFVTPDTLDTPIDFDSIRSIGASLGSGPVFGKSMAESECIGCGRCVEICPTGAIYAMEHKDELLYYAHHDGLTTAASVSVDLIPELERVLKLTPGRVTLFEIAGALKKIGVDAVYDTRESEEAAKARAEALLDEKLKGGGRPAILTNSFAAKAFLEKNFPDKKDSFLFYDSPAAVFGKAIGADKRFVFGAVGGDAAECEKIGCVDIAVNPRELCPHYDPHRLRTESEAHSRIYVT